MKPEDIYQVLYHLTIAGVGAGSILKGTDFVSWFYQEVSGREMPGHAKAICSLAIALLAPPAAYAVLLVDSGLTKFDFFHIVAVVGASFMGAWAWYQKRKYGEQPSPLVPSEGPNP